MNSFDVRSRLRPQAETLKRFGVASLKLFGSVSRGSAQSGSDVDLLVQFDSPPNYDRYMDLKFHLETVLGVKVDLVTENALRPEMREAVEKDLLLVA
jgi:uncharacterized protein